MSSAISEGERLQDIVLIGPIGAGKSTLGRLLAQRLQLPQVAVDTLRFRYYEAIGYDEDLADKIEREEGFLGKYRYWKPFEAHAVERILAEHRDCVIDFGAGHSVFDDPLFARVQQALAPYDNVVLLLPSADLDESIQLLRGRHGAIIDHGVDFDEYFAKHRSNHDLATITVYTKGRSPEESCADVLGRVQHAPRWSTPLAARPRTLERANALCAGGSLAGRHGDDATAEQFLQESFVIQRALDNERGVADALQGLGERAQRRRDYAAARRFLAESLLLRRRLSAAPDVARTCRVLGTVARDEGDFAAARSWFEESLGIWQGLGRRAATANLLNMVGEAAREQGDYARAAAAYEESLTLEQASEDRRAIAGTLCAQGHLARVQGDYSRARACYGASLEIWRDLKEGRGSAAVLEGLAALAAVQSQPERALRLGGAAAALRGNEDRQRSPTEQALIDRWLQPAREQLSGQVGEGAWADGQALSLEDAVAYALRDLNGVNSVTAARRIIGP